MSGIRIGATVYSKKGTRATVMSVNDSIGILTDAGLRLVKASSLNTSPPVTAFKIGEKVEYIGSSFNLKKQYAGLLEVWEISRIDGYTCLKPNGRLTSWIEFTDLRLSDV
jgi:hypothetical protein